MEDVGGFCLLGHPLRLEPLIPSVSDIRDEVERAWMESAARSVDRLVAAPPRSSEAHTSPPEPDGRPRPPEPPLGEPAGEPARYSPPPAPDGAPGHRPTVWESLEEGDDDEPGLSADPIAAFAPPPRMDWGPERSAGLGSLALRRRPPRATAEA